MEQARIRDIEVLVNERIQKANKYIDDNKTRAVKSLNESEEAEIPGFENRIVKFGQFIEKEFVVMMTDIRRSTEIINGIGGVENMFRIFYVYAAIVAKIVDSYGGTSTEFLGDGVLNLFDTDESRDKAFKNSISASWDILYAREHILNPTFRGHGLPEISIGSGIDYGPTIVTRFGYKSDNDLKAFGKCAYNVSRLCKGENEIFISEEAKQIWPSAPGGTLKLDHSIISGKIAYKAAK